MKWTALNGLGTLFWLVGLCFALGVTRGSAWAAWWPTQSLPIGAALGAVGLVTLLWANLGGA